MTDDIIPIEEARSRKAKKTTVAPQKPVEQKDKGGSTQRDKLIACAADADLWHDADGTGYAALAERGHVEHYLLRSKGCRDWLG